MAIYGPGERVDAAAVAEIADSIISQLVMLEDASESFLSAAKTLVAPENLNVNGRTMETNSTNSWNEVNSMIETIKTALNSLKSVAAEKEAEETQEYNQYLAQRRILRNKANQNGLAEK